MPHDGDEQFDRREIRVIRGILRDEAIDVFRRYGERDDTVVYHARGSAVAERQKRGDLLNSRTSSWTEPDCFL
ncbi:hypothetical protein AB0D04_39655 [Streptomyces sp. NPDC048483]|uniref:hypothetical protein n=1 Tax=Streptomyces sp. NPDC048483 TaxID=3154927 RepID=UPI0034342A9B